MVDEVSESTQVDTYTQVSTAGAQTTLGMIDSGASVTVCGSEWIDKWLPVTTARNWTPGTKRFRFGDGRNVMSEGCVVLYARLTDTMNSSGVVIRLRTDIVNGSLPLLISFSSLHLTKCGINFEQMVLIRGNATTPLWASKSGHIFVNLQPIDSGLRVKGDLQEVGETIFSRFGSKSIDFKGAIDIPGGWKKSDNTFMTNQLLPVQRLDDREPNRATPTSNNDEMSLRQIRKLHVQLGHVSDDTRSRLLTNAQKSMDIKIIHRALGPCKCEKRVLGCRGR